MDQLQLFPIELKSVFLRADSKKNAFYYMKIFDMGGYFIVAKESGIGEKVIDTMVWETQTEIEAIKIFTKKISQKKSKLRDRTYREVKPRTQ